MMNQDLDDLMMRPRLTLTNSRLPTASYVGYIYIYIIYIYI